MEDVKEKFNPKLHEELYRKKFLTAGKKKDSKGRLIVYFQVGQKIVNAYSTKSLFYIRYYIYNVFLNLSLLYTGQWDTNKANLDDIFVCTLMYADEALTCSENQLNGIVTIFDFKEFSFAHVRQCSSNRLKNVISALQVNSSLKSITPLHECN